MVRQTKRFKKGLNKKVLSAILAASMIMTSSSFAMAATNPEPLNEDAQTTEAPVADELEGLDDVTEDIDGDLTDDTADNNAATYSSLNTNDSTTARAAVDVVSSQVNIDPVTFNGLEQEPEVKSVYVNGFLVDKADYRVEYYNNKDAGGYEGDEDKDDIKANPYVEIIFERGAFAGTDPIIAPFVINPAPIGTADVKWEEVESFVYDGTVHHPAVESATIKLNQNGKDVEYALSADDYEVVDSEGREAGKNDDIMISACQGNNKYVIHLKGKGNFTGDSADTCAYAIEKADLSKADVTVTVDQVAYKNDLKKADILKGVKVVENATDTELKYETDYNIQYQDKNGNWTSAGDLIPDSGKNIGVHKLRVVVTDTSRNYKAKTYIETTYEVVASSLATAVKNAKVRDFDPVYTGDNKFPVDLEKALTGIDLEYGLDYVITTPEEEWVNVGEYSLELEGRNEYAGQTATVTVEVTPKALPKNIIVEQGTHRSGDLGSVIITIPDTIQKDGENKEVILEEGKDYTFEVTKEATKTSPNGEVEVTGIGNYTTEAEKDGVIPAEFDLKDKLPLSDPSISVEVVSEFAYDGDSIVIAPSDFKLVETDGSDTYILESKEYAIQEGSTIPADFAGTHAVKLIGAGEYYEGSRVVNVEVSGLSFEDTFDLSEIKDVSLDDEAQSYTELLKDFKVTYKTSGGTYTKVEKTIYGPDGKEIPVGTWADKITEPGTYTVKVESSEDKYVGSLETTFNVIGHDLKKAGAVVADIEDQVYTSEAITPVVTVKVGDKTLVAGEDYEVTYTDNVKGGEATAIITGINNYSGTLEKNFNITRAAQGITMTNPLQERDLGNGSRTSTSKVCTLKLATTMADEDTKYTYTTSDPSVATVNAGKITYQGVGECTITVSAAATDSCEAASLDIKVVVGKPGTPTFTPSVTKNTGKKAFVVTSSTVKGVDGWEVQYSIRDDFWKATTKDFAGTKTKLLRQTCKTVHSNMTYYVRVRGYQTVNGEKVYSDWSPVKTIKTK